MSKNITEAECREYIKDRIDALSLVRAVTLVTEIDMKRHDLDSWYYSGDYCEIDTGE